MRESLRDTTLSLLASWLDNFFVSFQATATTWRAFNECANLTSVSVKVDESRLPISVFIKQVQLLLDADWRAALNHVV